MGGRDPVHLLPRPHCQEAGSKQSSQDSDTTKFIHSLIHSFIYLKEGESSGGHVLSTGSLSEVRSFFGDFHVGKWSSGPVTLFSQAH